MSNGILYLVGYICIGIMVQGFFLGVESANKEAHEDQKTSVMVGVFWPVTLLLLFGGLLGSLAGKRKL